MANKLCRRWDWVQFRRQFLWWQEGIKAKKRGEGWEEKSGKSQRETIILNRIKIGRLQIFSVDSKSISFVWHKNWIYKIPSMFSSIFFPWYDTHKDIRKMRTGNKKGRKELELQEKVSIWCWDTICFFGWMISLLSPATLSLDFFWRG